MSIFKTTLLFSLTASSVLSQLATVAKPVLPIEGTWTCHRPAYGTDTLIISGDQIYRSFIYNNGLRRLYAKITDYSIRPGKIKYEYYRKVQANVEESVKPEIGYMIFELAAEALWTLSNSKNYPERQYLKINAGRDTWKNDNFKFYFEQFYNDKTNDCNDEEGFETYLFQKDKSNLKLATINPKFEGGIGALQEYFDNNLLLPESIDGIFGIINISFKVNCNGSVGEVTNLSSILPKTSKTLLKLVEQMPARWIPAYDNYKRISCYTRLKFIIKQGKVRVDYR